MTKSAQAKSEVVRAGRGFEFTQRFALASMVVVHLFAPEVFAKTPPEANNIAALLPPASRPVEVIAPPVVSVPNSDTSSSSSAVGAVTGSPSGGNSSASLMAKLKKKKRSSGKQSLKWRLGLTNLDWQNKAEHTNATGASVDVRYEHHPLSWLTLKAAGFAKGNTSYAQSQFGEMQPRSGLGVTEAYAQVQPVDALRVQAGIIDQGQWGVSALVDQTPWPGVVESLKFGEDYSAELRAQQAVPTSSTLSTKATAAETMPNADFEMLRLAAEPKDGFVSGHLFGGHWVFVNLPLNTASDSEVLGNSVVEDGKATRFKYKFEGWFAGGEVRAKFSESFSLGLHNQTTQNLRAPEGYRNSQVIGGDFELKLANDIDLNPSLDSFFVESDAAPGSFNATEYGHNNRYGFMASMAVTFNRQKIRLLSIYSDADVINPNAIQTRQQFIFFKIETLYALL